MKIIPKGALASRLRQRKFELLRQFPIPDDLLPGSLVLNYTRCGKPSCHCAKGKGHATCFWTSSTHSLGMRWACLFPPAMKTSDQAAWPLPFAQWQEGFPQRV